MSSSTVWRDTLARLKGQLGEPAHDALSRSTVRMRSGGGLVSLDVEPEGGVEMTEDDERAVLEALSRSAARRVSVRFDKASAIGENDSPTGAVVALRVEILEGIKMPSIGENDPPIDA
jgi:hypothetical protein